MAKLDVTLEGKAQISSGTWSFTLGLDGQAFEFRAGQTIDLTFPNPPHNDAAGNKRTFSLAGGPAREHLLVATRVRDSAFKRSLVEAPEGTKLEIEGPFGSFTLPQKTRSVVMLAGGIGVTPFRSMIEDAIYRGLQHPLTLVHSNRTPEDAPFLKEFQEWGSAGKLFTYLPTMTDMASSKVAWTGERRLIGPAFLGELLPKLTDNPIFYAAGPERFVKAAVDTLNALKVDEERIRFEDFPGY